MSKVYQEIILPEVQQDIRGIVLYIARQLSAPQAALHLENIFEKEIQSFSQMPKRFQTVEEQPWKDMKMRKVKIKSYDIYSLVDDADQTVKANAVIYTGRDQTKQLNKRKYTHDLS